MTVSVGDADAQVLRLIDAVAHDEIDAVPHTAMRARGLMNRRTVSVIAPEVLSK